MVERCLISALIRPAARATKRRQCDHVAGHRDPPASEPHRDVDLGGRQVSGRVVRIARCRERLDGMGVDPAEIEQAVALVGMDLSATLGVPSETAEAVARTEAIAAAEIMNQWDDDVSWPRYLTRVVEETQQWLHDTFLDTTWPTCPEHGNHPLWLNDDESPGWACASTNTTVCPVGHLGALFAVDSATAARNTGRLAANTARDAAMLARLDRGLRRRGLRRRGS